MLVESFSGIRGVYNKDFGLDTVRKYAFVFCEMLKEENDKVKVVVGADTRPSSDEIKKEFIRVFTYNGVDVVDVGINPVQAIENAARVYSANGGVVVSASHNPPEQNGFKLLDETGAVLEPERIKEIIRRVHETEIVGKVTGDFRKVLNMHDDCVEQYLKFVFDIVGKDNTNLIKEFKTRILFDPNGGAACAVIPKLIERLGLDAEVINKRPGVFSRAIEPDENSLGGLMMVVKRENFHFAIAFDCDADRGEFVLDGKIMSGHYALALVVDDFLSGMKNPEKQIIVVNDATSGVVREVASRHGAMVKEVEVGEINIVKEMERNNSLVGGEGSSNGVIYSPSKCRDSILTLVLILKIMAKKNKRLKDLINQMPRYFTVAAKVVCSPEKHKEIRKRLKDVFARERYQIQETGTDGGLKVYFSEKAWLWFRASKTEAGVYRVIADSPYEEESKRLLREGVFVLNQIEKQIK